MQYNTLQHMTGLEQQQEPFAIVLNGYTTHFYTTQMNNISNFIHVPEYLVTKNITHKLKSSQL